MTSVLPSRELLLAEVEAAENRADAIREIATRYGVYPGTVRRNIRGVQGQGAGKNIAVENAPRAAQVILNNSVMCDQPEPEPEEVLPEPVADESMIANEKYTHNLTTDTYITYLDRAGIRLRFSGDKHRAMLAAYSRWDGHGATINEICMTYGMSREWFNEYKQIHEWTHDHDPFVAEVMLAEPEETLVVRALQAKRLSVFRKFESAKWNEIQSGYEKWVDLEQNLMLPLMEHIQKYAPLYKPVLLELKKADDPFAVVFAAFDLHYSKSSWRDETGESYSRAEARDLLLFHTKALAKEVARYGRPDQIIVPLGQDWFHVDNPQHMTTAGTPQDMDGTYAQMIMEGMDLAVDYINLLRQIAPVTIVFCDGNHDRASSLSMAMYVRAWFRKDADVTCQVAATPRHYLEYGNNLLGVTHGDGEKRTQLATLMASEAREAWGRTENRAFYTGHIHHKIEEDEDGITVNTVSSLSAADRWHKRKGFNLSRRALTAFIIDKIRGAIATLTSPVDHPINYGFNLPGNTYVKAA